MKELRNKKYEQLEGSNAGDGIITIFTPSFNRAKYLPRIYSSLIEQTSQSFVWILVNDGSADNTDEIAERILGEERIPMLFISKENGHKHSCFKAAFERCNTEFFMCMDDDDIYSPKTVELFLTEWYRIKQDGIKDIGAIRALSEDKNGIVSNVPIEEKDLGKTEDASTLERNYVQHIYQENCTCYETAKLREVELFPQDYWLHEYHRFFLESIWQGRFARRYKCRYINIPLRKYTNDAPDSILRVSGGKSRQHYMDMFINSVIINNEQFDYIRKDFKALFKSVVLLNLLRGYLNIGLLHLLKNTEFYQLRLLLIFTAPLRLLGPAVIRRRNTN